MYAIIRAGGKQYTVRAGDTLRVEKLPKELGTEFNIDEVLLVGGEQVHVGEPTVKNASVTLVVTQQDKSPQTVLHRTICKGNQVTIW
jgi:large subunit ribosomal protein L21